MASSSSNAARKKPANRAKKTAETVATKAAPKVESKKKQNENVASVKKVASISEISNKSAGPGRIQLWIDAVKRFLKSVRGEMDRVSWPSWKELRSSTIVVVVTLLMISMYMGVVDWVLSLLFGTPSTGF